MTVKELIHVLEQYENYPNMHVVNPDVEEIDNVYIHTFPVEKESIGDNMEIDVDFQVKVVLQ